MTLTKLQTFMVCLTAISAFGMFVLQVLTWMVLRR